MALRGISGCGMDEQIVPIDTTAGLAGGGAGVAGACGRMSVCGGGVDVLEVIVFGTVGVTAI